MAKNANLIFNYFKIKIPLDLTWLRINLKTSCLQGKAKKLIKIKYNCQSNLKFCVGIV